MQKKFFHVDNFLQNALVFAYEKENAEIPAKSEKTFKMPCVQNFSKPQYLVSDKINNRNILLFFLLTKRAGIDILNKTRNF